MLTLKKGKELVEAPVHTKRVPSPKVLLEEDLILMRKEFDHGSHLTVYQSGYVLFSAGKPRMRGPHPHRQGRPHRKDHPQPCEHHGGARTADRQSHPDRCRAHRTILPGSRPPLPRPAEPREADHHAQAGRHLVRRQRFQLGKPECPLQFKQVPYAEPPCHLYKRNH